MADQGRRTYREQLIETAVEQDDELLMEKYLEGEEPDTRRRSSACIRKGTIATSSFFPTYCGSSIQEQGGAERSRRRCRLPAQSDRSRSRSRRVDLEGKETGEVATVDPAKPLRALAFKIMDDRFGALTFTRDLLRHAQQGRHHAQHRNRQDRAHWPSWWKCMPTTASMRRFGRRRATSSPSWA